MPTIDDFEDGDVAGWTGDTDTLSAVTDSLSGTYSGEFVRGASPSFAEVQSPPITSDEYVTLSVLVSPDQADGNASLRITPLTDGNELGRLEHAPNGDLLWDGGAGDAVVTLGTFTFETTYQYDITIDVANDTASVSRDGTVLDTGLSLRNNFGAGITGMAVAIDGAGDTTTSFLRFDDITATTPAVTTVPPSNLTATSETDSEVSLSWDEPPTDYTETEIYRATTAGSSVGDYTSVDSVAAGTESYTDTGLTDGREYHYRVRVVDGSDTSPLSTEATATTPLPPAESVVVDRPSVDQVSLSWDRADNNPDGSWAVYRATTDTLGSAVTTGLSPTTTTYSESVDAQTTYYYTIRRTTPDAQADAGTFESRPGDAPIPERGVPGDGWYVEVIHPETARRRTPDVVDLQNAPVFNPGPNQQPVVRIPVAKNTVWLREAYDADPQMRVWRDGRRLPIEVLRNVEQREGATILVGVGGVELEGRVTEEYNDDRRHLAVRDLVETETTYGVDAPEPDTATLEDVVQQNPDTDGEFTAMSSFADTTPLLIENGVVKGAQVNHVIEGEDRDRGSASPGSFAGDSNGQSLVIAGATEDAEWDVSTAYTHPADSVGVWFRLGDVDDAFATDVSLRVNGTSYDLGTIPTGFSSQSYIWINLADDSFTTETYSGPDIAPSDDIEIVAEGNSSGGGSTPIDVVALTDERFDVTFPDTLTNGYLNGPGTHVAQDAVFDNAPSAFNVTAGSADITINDTTGAQRLQISNDNGATWLPDDGSEQNTTSVDVDYPAAGSGSRLRVTLDAYEPDGPRDQTPRLNYASQELDAFTLRADITQELLLIAETFDNSLTSVLSSIGEPAERSWGLQTDENGDIVVRFVQNGQFVADFTPEFSDRTREKLGKTYESVTVKGSNEPESNVPYTASTSYTALPRNNILTGSETVYDDTTNYERGDDYEMRYRDGEIRATEGGDLEAGTDYRIDFRYQAQGTFEAPDAPADPDELVETVPGVTSERLAEQVAFVIASEADAPRYAAEVTVPDPDPRFDPTEALPPSALGLPSVADDLEVRGEPQLTEEGLRVRFGTRPSVEQTQQRLSRQLSRVSDRS